MKKFKKIIASNKKNLVAPLILILIVLLGIFISEALHYYKNYRIPGALSIEEATEKAMNYINSNLLDGGIQASLLESKSESGVYSIKIEIEEREYLSYITKDGKVLFLQGMEIPDENPTSSGVAKRDVPDVQLFVMSFCSFGNQAEEIMMNVVNLLGNKANIELHYVIYSNYAGGGKDYCLDDEAKYCSMHGIQELNQGIRELCVQKYQKDKLWDFIKQVNANCNYQDVDSCWDSIARGVGVDVDMVKKCENEEGLAMAEQELQLNKKYGITGSPQLVINDEEYNGSRSAEAYKTAICEGFNALPNECSQTLSNDGGNTSGGCE